MKKNNKGTLFWVTGFSGSGKTQISKKIYPQIKKKYGPTVFFSGDDIRRIFKLRGYSYNDRFQTVMKYCKLAKLITSQNINVLFAVIGMMDGIRNWNKKNIKNYVEIYIKSDLKKIINKKKKKIYQKYKKDIVGLDISQNIQKNLILFYTTTLKKTLNLTQKI